MTTAEYLALTEAHAALAPAPEPDDARTPSSLQTGPFVALGTLASLLFLAGLLGWWFNGVGEGSETTAGGIEFDALAAPTASSIVAQADLAGAALLPTRDEPGLVGIELALLDPYTGTGSTGSVELYLNAATGKVCHRFDAPVMTGQYRAYMHEAEFPREGPIVVDLGEVTNADSRCVDANALDVARALAEPDAFYVATHSTDRSILLRAQLAAGTTTFDNRDPTLIDDQPVVLVAGETELFGGPAKGAYIRLAAGRVVFEGSVPDQETAERLRAAFIPLSGLGVEVIDKLKIEPTAPLPSGRVLVDDALLFGTANDQVETESAVLTTLSDLLRVNPLWTMTITGHTDDVGDWLFNVELSLRRANNVRARLLELGVPEERIRVQGAGPEQPIGDNQTPEGRALNRRIELSIDA